MLFWRRMVTPGVEIESAANVELPVAPVAVSGVTVPAQLPITEPPAPVSVVAPTAGPPAAFELPRVDEAVFLRQRLAQLESEREAETTERSLQVEARQVLNDAVARGLSEEDANWMAQRHYALARRVQQQEATLQRNYQIAQGRQNAAVAIGSQYGVSPAILMSAESPQQMHEIAQREKRYTGLERDIQVLKQAQVPSQPLNSAGYSQAGGPTLTADNIDALHLEGKVSDDLYRKFLTTGQIR